MSVGWSNLPINYYGYKPKIGNTKKPIFNDFFRHFIPYSISIVISALNVLKVRNPMIIDFVTSIDHSRNIDVIQWRQFFQEIWCVNNLQRASTTGRLVIMAFVKLFSHFDHWQLLFSFLCVNRSLFCSSHHVNSTNGHISSVKEHQVQNDECSTDEYKWVFIRLNKDSVQLNCMCRVPIPLKCVFVSPQSRKVECWLVYK